MIFVNGAGLLSIILTTLKIKSCFKLCLLLFCREGNDPADDGKITYSELKDKVCQFANVLKSIGEYFKNYYIQLKCWNISNGCILLLILFVYYTNVTLQKAEQQGRVPVHGLCRKPLL